MKRTGLLGAAMAFAVAIGPGSLFAQASLLPKSGEIGEWKFAADPERYVKDSLYGYIDGGAELYLPYGFDNVEVGHFTRTPGNPAREIAIEIWQMASPLEAFGIFSVQREGDDKSSAALPLPNWILPGQTAFIKGSFFVTVQGVPADDESVQAMARAVAGRINPGGDIFATPPLSFLRPKTGGMGPNGLSRVNPRPGPKRSSSLSRIGVLPREQRPSPPITEPRKSSSSLSIFPSRRPPSTPKSGLNSNRIWRGREFRKGRFQAGIRPGIGFFSLDGTGGRFLSSEKRTKSRPERFYGEPSGTKPRPPIRIHCRMFFTQVSISESHQECLLFNNNGSRPFPNFF